MRGWAKKHAVLAATKSNAVAGWLSEYNEGVPGEIQGRVGERVAKEGCVLMSFLTPMDSKYTIDIPEEFVTFEHKMFRHSVPYRALALVHEIERLVGEQP